MAKARAVSHGCRSREPRTSLKSMLPISTTLTRAKSAFAVGAHLRTQSADCVVQGAPTENVPAPVLNVGGRVEPFLQIRVHRFRPDALKKNVAHFCLKSSRSTSLLRVLPRALRSACLADHAGRPTT